MATEHSHTRAYVAHASPGVSQMFPLLLLGNGCADCVKVWYAIRGPLVVVYPVVTSVVFLHVRVCTLRRISVFQYLSYSGSL